MSLEKSEFKPKKKTNPKISLFMIIKRLCDNDYLLSL